ncbi:MAG TPA: OB-fold nucleic acid binding domain-containing protein, partial [Flavisolibacter sp.]|nr:OB-fold nucleic acid binding domain-containing protein [Flavisolibacter sp.]
MFNNRVRIKDLLTWEAQEQAITVMGWVRTFRNNQFVALNDGSTNNNVQVVLELGKFDDDLLKRITTSAALKVKGTIIPSLGKGQKLEIKANEVEILGDSDAEKYPLQPKKHSLEFLREIAHLRFRTNTFGSVFRIRHSLSFAVHKFFNDKGFLYLHTPIITASDAEGAGETFHVTTLPIGNPPKKDDGSIDYSEDFFGRSTNLTVSGQLEGELGATAFGDIYT